MRIADDVKIPPSLKGIQPQIVAAFPIIESVFLSFGKESILTSGTEGQHMAGSLHPKGLAADWRIHHVPQAMHAQLIEKLQKALGKEFQVILELDHAHVEFDPK
jgi:hypothetical protein